MNPTTGKPLYSLVRINRLRNNIKTFDDIDKVRKGVLVVDQIEPMNIAVGRIPEGIAENRSAKEGFGYLTMKKDKERLLTEGAGVPKGGVDSTRAKTSTPFMTVWEAVNGKIDPAVELHLKALGDAEQSFKRIKDRPNSVVNWYKTEFLPRHAAAIDKYKVDEITAKISDYQTAVKNKSGGATKIREEIADALSAAKMVSATTGLSAGGALRNMKKKFPAVTDLSQIATHNLTEVRKHVERTEFLKGLLKFAKKDDAGGTLYKVEDLVNSAYLDKLGRGGKHMGSLVDGIKGSFLDYDTFKTAQQYLSFVNDDASLTNLLKKVSDFTKAFMVAGPGFITRNMVSNMVMGHAAGDSVFDPATWARMSEVGRFLTWDGRLKNPDQIVEILGKNYTSKQIMDMAEFAGAIGPTRAEQFVEKAVGKEGTAKKIALAYPRLIRDASNGREQISKVSHFLSRLRQGWSPDDASLSVAKYFYDYGSLTPTERKIQAFVPFYSFLRLNTERQIRNLIEQPTYLSQPQKLANAMSSASEDTAGTPQDWTPEWIQRGGQMLMPSGSYGTLQAWMPQMDILRALPSTWAQTAGESLTPALRIPLELSANKSWFTGKPIADVGRENAPFLGVSMDKRIPYAVGWARPLQELNKAILPAIPAYNKYATGHGAYTTGTPTENLASWATGLRTYPFEPKRLAMDRYRQISDDLMKLKSAAKSYQGSPGTLERLGNAAEAAQAELDDLRYQMKAQGDWSMGNKKKSTGLLGGSK
jgi:hypothetical protein